MPRLKPQQLRLVRIICDTRDATLDYFIPQGRADDLYRAGRLDMISVYATSEWQYATRSRVQVR